MKYIISIFSLILNFFLFSQKQYQNTNGFLLINSDTVAQIQNYDLNLEKRLLKEEKLSIYVNNLKQLNEKEKKELVWVVFYNGCDVVWLDTIVENEIESVITNTNDTIRKQDDLLSRLLLIENENKKINLRIESSSNYLIKSANQKNLSLIIGIGGSLISTGLITFNSMMGYSPSDKPTGAIIGIASSAAFLTLQITSNINLKKAGLKLNK